MSGGGLVHIVGVLALYAALHFIIGAFILNTLCLYVLNAIKYTKRFVNFYFILGEFVGNFVGYIASVCLYKIINDKALGFGIIAFAFASSFVLLVLNMFLLTIRYRVFEKSRYESLLSSHSKKLWLKNSFVFGICFSFVFTCIWIILFTILKGI